MIRCRPLSQIHLNNPQGSVGFSFSEIHGEYKYSGFKRSKQEDVHNNMYSIAVRQSWAKPCDSSLASCTASSTLFKYLPTQPHSLLVRIQSSNLTYYIFIMWVKFRRFTHKETDINNYWRVSWHTSRVQAEDWEFLASNWGRPSRRHSSANQFLTP